MNENINLINNELKKKKNLVNKKYIKIFNIEIIIFIFNFIIFLYLHSDNSIYVSFDSNFLSKFRNIEHFSISLAVRSYHKIAEYLKNKYTNNKDFLIKEQKLLPFKENIEKKPKERKKIKIYGSGMHQRWKTIIENYVKEKYIIEYDKENPDYFFYTTFSCNCYLPKYQNSVIIAYFAENQLPDFDIADYGIAHGHINYLDRYIYSPSIFRNLLYKNISNKDFKLARENALKQKNRTKFCAALISNVEGKRIELMEEINKYKKIDHGGSYNNNVGGKVQDKVSFLKSYKFSIAMENSDTDGYTTEKIMESFLGGTIPIYYGGYMLDEFFNPKSYILIRGKRDLKKKIEYIKKIDNDDELYRSILKENVLLDEKVVESFDKAQKEFFLNIFDQDKKYAKRIDNYHFK